MDSITIRDLQLALPRSLSLFYSGAFLFSMIVETRVRDAHPNPRTRLHYWSAANEKRRSFLSIICGSAVLAGVNSYRLTKQKLWLHGSLTVAVAFVYWWLAVRKIEAELEQQNEQAEEELLVEKRDGILKKMESWRKRFLPKSLFYLIGAGIFYLAERKSK